MEVNLPKFEELFSFENILKAFNEFKNNKRNKTDVAEFSINMIGNLYSLHKDLISGNYKHGGYKHFKINDPKSRDIHKASVRDRIVHHCLYRSLYDYFNKFFIYDSYSCRFGKGTHKALDQFLKFGISGSLSNKKTVWILKCDIKKCFASVDQNILKIILKRHIFCPKILGVINSVIDSFNSGFVDKGLPLGNLTSQLFINIYLNELDQVMKKIFNINKYVRYADDFVIFNKDKDYLLELTPKIAIFLEKELKLLLHPDKIHLKTFASGMDFLGWVHFPNHRVLRTSTKKRMFRKIIEKDGKKSVVESYLGMLNHGNAHKLSLKVKDFMI